MEWDGGKIQKKISPPPILLSLSLTVLSYFRYSNYRYFLKIRKLEYGHKGCIGMW